MALSLAAVTAFVDREAMLLDQNRLMDWLELFTEDGFNWIPLVPEQTDPREGPTLVHDTKDMLLARVYRFGDPANLPQNPPSRCSRVMGRPVILGNGEAGADHGGTVARTPFHLIEAVPHLDADVALRHFAGSVTHCLVGPETAPRIRWRRVDLINSERAMHGVSIIV